MKSKVFHQLGGKGQAIARTSSSGKHDGNCSIINSIFDNNQNTFIEH